MTDTVNVQTDVELLAEARRKISDPTLPLDVRRTARFDAIRLAVRINKSPAANQWRSSLALGPIE